MSAIITGVFKVTIGLAATKARDVLAEKLKEGDVTDQKFRDLIVSDIKDIKSKLDAMSRKDLGAAVDFFETGLRCLNAAVYGRHSDSAIRRAAQESERNKEKRLDELTLPSATSPETTVVLASRVKNIQLTNLVDEEAKRALFDAKDRFSDARKKATDASNNEALSTFDQITAIRYRVMAAMLESAADMAVGTAGDLRSTLKRALPECEQCLQKLHSLPAVQKSFNVEIEKSLLNVRGRFGKDERRDIISIVCQINRVIYDATQAAGGDVNACVWPSVDTDEDKVDPLRDGRISKVLHKVNMEHCCVTWSFGQQGDEEHKLKNPRGIATNHRGQFLIADDGDKTVKVFDSNGKFDFRFNPQTDDADTELYILDVATADEDDKIYLVVELKKPGAEKWEKEVQVFNKTGDLQHKFPVRRGGWGRLTVSSCKKRGKILLLTDYDVVGVHEPSGEFVCSFGGGVFKNAIDITATCDGRVMILDWGDDSLYIFDVEGHQLGKFNIKHERDVYYRIACHQAIGHVVLACHERETRRLTLAIYTVNGEFVRRIQLDEKVDFVYGITVTAEGHIAVALQAITDEGIRKAKVIVV
ncbi:unnamed protein product [Porites lobata]|uniref:Uncharacterized protein n=1 Tax=Porites lobata TaxID=104759 RepID=A0ABN8P6H9_9CNID|nr:unnamed protein product [Porites lobata]